jgi:hypothetical protein
MSRPNVGTSQISATTIRKICNAPPPTRAAIRAAGPRRIAPVTMSVEATEVIAAHS